MWVIERRVVSGRFSGRISYDNEQIPWSLSELAEEMLVMILGLFPWRKVSIGIGVGILKVWS